MCASLLTVAASGAFAVAMLVTSVGPARAEPFRVPAEARTGAALTGPVWLPPSPVAEDFDWIRLKSGEWLKGDIERLRDEILEFDSEELDDLTFDWEDVIELHSPREHVYRFEAGIVVTGPAVIRDSAVIISVDGEQREFPRARLVAIVPAAESELDHWSGRASLGATFRSGNTDQVELSTVAWIRRETARSRIRIDYDASFGELNGVENVNTHRAQSKLDLYLSRDFFVTPVSIEAFSDPFTNVRLRLTPGAGVGYHVLRGRVDWVLQCGAAYQRTAFESISETESPVSRNGVVLLGTVLETELTKRVDFDAEYQVQVVVPELGASNHNLVAVLSLELTRVLDLDVSLTWDRVESPPPLDDGTRPEKNDYRLVVGLALEF